MKVLGFMPFFLAIVPTLTMPMTKRDSQDFNSAGCQNATITGTKFEASCLVETLPGTTLRAETSVDINGCVSNNNGEMQCGGQGVGNSCNGFFIVQQTPGIFLQGFCLNGSGKSAPASVDLNKCLSLNNGVLQCTPSVFAF